MTPPKIIEDIEQFRKTQKAFRVSDLYGSQTQELLSIFHPSSKKGNWVFFPWNGNLVHMVCEEDLTLLRTNRNKNLITSEEQEKLYSVCIGIAGLSVGGNIAAGLAQSGIAKNMKLAERDSLDTTNLNRLRARVDSVGEKKIDIISQQIYEINPYVNLMLFDKGLTAENLDDFFKDPKPDLVFDEIDDFEMKVRLRIKAREEDVPVLMMTSLGDNVLVDVERYDLDNNLKLFNGLLGDLPEEILKNPIGEMEKVKYAIQIVGIQHIPTRALKSLFEINKTLVGRPQLASTVAVSSGLASYLVRKLVLFSEPKSGRYCISFNDAFNLKEEDASDRNGIVKKLEDLINK